MEQADGSLRLLPSQAQEVPSLARKGARPWALDSRAKHSHQKRLKSRKQGQTDWPDENAAGFQSGNPLIRGLSLLFGPSSAHAELPTTPFTAPPS